MTREIKALLICNVLTLIVAIAACFFAFEARKEAMDASFSADWGLRNSADEFSQIKDSLKKISDDTELMSADARAKEQIDRLIRGY